MHTTEGLFAFIKSLPAGRFYVTPCGTNVFGEEGESTRILGLGCNSSEAIIAYDMYGGPDPMIVREYPSLALIGQTPGSLANMGVIAGMANTSTIQVEVANSKWFYKAFCGNRNSHNCTGRPVDLPADGNFVNAAFSTLDGTITGIPVIAGDTAGQHIWRGTQAFIFDIPTAGIVSLNYTIPYAADRIWGYRIAMLSLQEVLNSGGHLNAHTAPVSTVSLNVGTAYAVSTDNPAFPKASTLPLNDLAPFDATFRAPYTAFPAPSTIGQLNYLNPGFVMGEGELEITTPVNDDKVIVIITIDDKRTSGPVYDLPNQPLPMLFDVSF